MPKKYFCIQVGAYNSELAIGSVTKEFLKFWESRCTEIGDESLLAALDGESNDIPDHLMPTFRSWYDACDVLSLCAVDEDDVYTVQEIELHPDVSFVEGHPFWNKGAEIPADNPFGESRFKHLGKPKQITGVNIGCENEVFWDDASNGVDDEEEDQKTPIIIFCSLDKGSRGSLFVELDGDKFDSSKFQYSVIETSAGTFAVQYWYDRKPLILEVADDGYAKGFSIQFGYIDQATLLRCDFSYKNGVESTELKEAFDDWYANNSGSEV